MLRTTDYFAVLDVVLILNMMLPWIGHRAMDSISRYIGLKLAHFLSKPRPFYEEFSTLSQQQLRQTLQPCDLLLVEGNSRFRCVI